jgi:hypothetical protein
MLKKVRAGAAAYPKFTFCKEHAAHSCMGLGGFAPDLSAPRPNVGRETPSFSTNLHFRSGKWR